MTDRIRGVNNGPLFQPGQVVEIILPGDITGTKLVGRRFALFGDPQLIEGLLWAWYAPPPWARELGYDQGYSFMIQECRMKVIGSVGEPRARPQNYDGNVKVSWADAAWRPHLDVVPDPRRPGLLVNVWDPLEDDNE